MVVAAASALLGVALLVLWSLELLHGFGLAVGASLMILGVGLVIVAVLLNRRLHRTLILTPTAITLVRGRARRTLKWSDIERVSLTGPRLVLVTKPGSGRSAAVINPGGHSRQSFAALIEAIRGKLDTDRGYRSAS
jgi:hypothetical protein